LALLVLIICILEHKSYLLDTQRVDGVAHNNWLIYVRSGAQHWCSLAMATNCAATAAWCA
jgi:hypothetical protein